jgi:hypothetical protein
MLDRPKSIVITDISGASYHFNRQLIGAGALIFLRQVRPIIFVIQRLPL